MIKVTYSKLITPVIPRYLTHTPGKSRNTWLSAQPNISCSMEASHSFKITIPDCTSHCSLIFCQPRLAKISKYNVHVSPHTRLPVKIVVLSW